MGPHGFGGEGSLTMAADTTPSRVVSITCPSCGEVYETPERVGSVLRNAGYCVNITCLEDLTGEPLDQVYSRSRGTRRFADRAASA